MPHAPITSTQQGRAKRLRRAMTRADMLVWRHIRAHRTAGLGFRRQVPIRNYIADFVSHFARIVIELDGESHDFASRLAADSRRDAFFKAQGYRVLRFTNEEVLKNLEGVIQTIQAVAEERVSAPPSLTLPHKGGGNRENVAPTVDSPRAIGQDEDR